MAQKSNLNVAPYYDDFEYGDNFQQVLFRPGFAVQARELTQLQSLLKNQIETSGRHLFKEGAMVVPGQASFQVLSFVKLETNFNNEGVDVTQYIADTPVIVTGATSGVKAMVIKSTAATTTDSATLFITYIQSGTNLTDSAFTAGENLSADIGITHTSSYSSNVVSCTVTQGGTGDAVSKGHTASATIGEGVYFIRGSYVRVAEETIIVDKYNARFSGRIGLAITETTITPEADSTLTDNAAGSSNFAAKGAHRLKIEAKLSSLSESSTADDEFVTLLSLRDGHILTAVRESEFGTIEGTFARRTFDESGDYTVRPFQFEVQECVTNNENEGVFEAGSTTHDGNAASTDLLSLKMSPGKAYVKGFELEKLAPTFKDFNKARDYNTVNAGITTFEIGNYVNITNIYGQPDVAFISGEASAYKMLELYDTPTTSRGSSSGTKIGLARGRTMQYSSGAVGSIESVYRLYIFDIRPFTFLTLTATPSPTLIANHSNGGVQITGVTTGATGFVFGDGTTGSKVILTNVAGNFQTGEKIKVSDGAEADLIVEDSGNTDLTISSIKINSFSSVRQFFMDDPDTGQDFSADVALSTQNTDASFARLDGTDADLSDSDDLLRMEDGTTVSTSLGDNVSIERGASAGTGSQKKVAALYDSEKNVSIFKMAKRTIKTHLTTNNSGTSDTQFQIRRQYITNASSLGAISINGEVNETFVSHSETAYALTVLTAGVNGSAQQGEIISAGTGFSGAGTGTVTISNVTALGNGAKVKVIATLLKTSINAKSKTVKLCKQLDVKPGATDAYGTRPTDKSISVGRADVFKIVGIFDSEDPAVDAVLPVILLSSMINVFTQGEQIIGQTSGAKARLINIASPIKYVLQKNSVEFIVGETIKGTDSSATGVISSLTRGSVPVTSRYLLDTGMRDNFYDFSRIIRRPGSESPLGRLSVIYDYMEHGPGDVFTADSYIDVANQMDYEDIPIYSASKVDPDDPQPTGQYPLQDVFDFRPRVEDASGTSSTVGVTDEVTSNTFDFYHRQFDGTGSSTVNFPPPGALVQSDFEYYLPRWTLVHMTNAGLVVITEGESAELPKKPKEPDGMMKLLEIFLPAYTMRPQVVRTVKMKNQRYTMRDIGRLEDRIENVEYYTALSLLERDAESFEIQDSNGLSRFKSGFVVDNFTGHRVGDVGHPDYKNSIDMEAKELRPQHKMKGITLTESVSTDVERAGSGYSKTGDIISLPYTEVLLDEQPYATRIERLTPVLLSNWVGDLSITPTSDEWFETEIAPALVVNVDGNFDTVFNNNRNAIGTIWNAWQTQWSGVTSSRQSSGVEGANTVTRAIQTTRTDLRRTGMRTDVVQKIDMESQGSKVIARAVIPYIRSRNIAFEGHGFYPNTRVYAFFDNKAVSKYCTPGVGYSTNDESIVQGVAMVISASGLIKGTFQIPNPLAAGNPVWQSGELQFRLTSSDTNTTSIDPATAGETIYYAKGILETEQETILAVRNAEVVRRSVSENTSRSSSTSQILSVSPNVAAATDGDDGWDGDGGTDPLAQTFFIEELPVAVDTTSEGTQQTPGVFITSIDIFFAEKDDLLQTSLEIRNVVNGTPGTKVIPFGRVAKQPSEINLSQTATVATTYTFPSPVYLMNNTEYCFVMKSHSPNHKVWISRMGETEIGGSRQVSKQPHSGVMFKSHNNRTWAPSLMEDVKYVMRRAKFDIGTPGVVDLINSDVEVKALQDNPLTFENGSTTLRVKQPDHHMYSTANNVTISGVKSNAVTTLNGAISPESTSFLLASNSDFDDTTGKFAYDASSDWYIKIDDEILKYNTITTAGVSGVTRGMDNTTAASHADGTEVELYMIHKVPFTNINKTHTALSNITIDSYTVTLLVAPSISGGVTTAENGGSMVTASQNAIYNTCQPNISTLAVDGTAISAKLQPTTGTSASGTEVSFTKTTLSNASVMTLQENFELDATQMVCSLINETNELSGSKSLIMPLTLTSNNSYVSPIIDAQRMSFVAVANRINAIDDSTDVYPTSDFVASTDPEGDNNSAIYMTKKVTLENPATALRVFFAGYRHTSATIQVMYKILRTDDASDFDDLGWTNFNSTGATDTVTNPSLTYDDLQQYKFTAGVKDDGTDSSLDEFISFSIKIVMKGTNSSQPIRIKDLRCIALAT